MNKHSINALIVAETAEAGQNLVNVLNKAGYSVKGAIATSANMLMKGLNSKPWDVVITQYDEHHSTLEQTKSAIIKSEKHTPLLAITAADKYSIQSRLNALQAGASDLIPDEPPKLLSLVLERELARYTTTASITTPPTEQQALSPEEQQWRDRLLSALENNRFITAFQPIVNLNAAPAENYEVLLRMLDEHDQEILPGSFINVAEKTGLMRDIDRWIITRTAETILDRLSSGTNTCFFIKLSEASITDSTFNSWLSELLHQHNLPHYSMVFEINEALAYQHIESSKALFTHARRLNCMTALDHVGNADSEDLTWSNFELDFIKIAGRLIRDLASNAQSQKAVTYIASQAKAHKIKTIAQFVQDTTSLTFLYQRSINYIQGYYLQRPDIALNYNFSENDE